MDLRVPDVLSKMKIFAQRMSICQKQVLPSVCLFRKLSGGSCHGLQVLFLRKNLSSNDAAAAT